MHVVPAHHDGILHFNHSSDAGLLTATLDSNGLTEIVAQGNKAYRVSTCNMSVAMSLGVTHTRSNLPLMPLPSSQDHYTRRTLSWCTAVAGHKVAFVLRVRQHAANAPFKSSGRRLHDIAAQTVRAEASTALTPLLHLQKRLESSGARLDSLDLSYKQCVAARRARQGEVCCKSLLLHQQSYLWSLTAKFCGSQTLLSIPGDLAVTKEDVAADSACSHLASDRSELIGLALWLIAQRSKVHHCTSRSGCRICFDAHPSTAVQHSPGALRMVSH